VGYSLIPYAGTDVSAGKYSIIETFSNGSVSSSLNLWVLEKDQTTVCAYLASRLSSDGGVVPGVFAINDPDVK
jgi:hypothetical protein